MQRRAFTLIELLITVAIIAVLAITALPSVYEYGDRTNYENKLTEIEGILNRLQLMARNPENDADHYKIDVSGNKIELQKVAVDGTITTIEKVSADKNQTIELVTPASYDIHCDPPGTDAESCKATSGITITDNNFSPARSRTFTIIASPYRVK